MPSDRIISQQEALFVGPSPASGAHIGASGQNFVTQLQRVQTANTSFQISRTDVNQFGELAAIDRIILEAPTVNLDFSYLIANVYNEKQLGFVVDGSSGVISNLLNGSQDQKNYFILQAPQGNDAVNGDTNTAANSVKAIGNGYLSNISWEFAVGQLPRATAQIQGFNIRTDLSSSGNNIPAVNTTNGLLVTGVTYVLPPSVSGNAVSALRPGDITLNISGVQGYSISDLKIQSASFSLPITREPIQRLGSKFAISRQIRFPISATVQISAVLGDAAAADLSNVLCNDQDFTLSLLAKLPNCSGLGATAASYTMIGAKLESQNETRNIGSNNSATFSFAAPLGGPTDSSHNVYVSGILT